MTGENLPLRGIADFAYVPTLDGMRAISILIVIASHYGLGFIFPGEFGVTIFFFISGYLITNLMIAEERATGAVSVKAFYARRILRLGPALLSMLAVLSVVRFLSDGSLNTAELLAAVFYFMNYYAIFWHLPMSALGPLWSLAVEEHYYLVYPSLFFWAWKFRRRFLVGLLTLCAAVLIWRTALFIVWDASRDRIAWSTDTRIDSILFGAILAVILNIPSFDSVLAKLDRTYVFGIATALLLLSFVWRNETFRETVRYSLQGASLVSVFYSILFVKRFEIFRRILSYPAITWVGRISYSLYLWHEVVPYFLSILLPKDTGLPLQYLLGVPLSFAAASLSYYFVEQPFKRIRKRLRHTQIQVQYAH
jgi:peptidoglycan/LPS O-acetylase OafA/YrhL